MLQSALQPIHDTGSRRAVIALALVACLCAFAIVRFAWLSDDSYITLRTVDNFWHGYGLRWNVIERVQAYTEPLWMLLLAGAYGITREAYFTTISVSLACAGAMMALLIWRLPITSAALALLLLAGSRAFVEFSTSGLANPLIHLLLAAFWLERLLSRRVTFLRVLAGLSGLTRLDVLALAIPALIAGDDGLRQHQTRARVLRSLLWAGLLPLVWCAFATFYYGTPLPNTALAKLNTGVSHAALAWQGVHYLYESLWNDPVTLTTVFVAGAWALAQRRAETVSLSISLGFYLTYVVLVGGDFMSGRFLTPAFVCAVIFVALQLGPLIERRPVAAGGVVLVVIALGISRSGSPLRVWTGGPVPEWTEPVPYFHGIVDEARFYYPDTGLLNVLLAGHRPEDSQFGRVGRLWRDNHLRIVVYEAVGLSGFHAGPGVHIVDPMGLTDAFLARQPALLPWRIGHFKRAVPEGYVQGLDACLQCVFVQKPLEPPSRSCGDWPSDTNRLLDPQRARQLDLIWLVTQGPLFDGTRLRGIVRLNTRW